MTNDSSDNTISLLNAIVIILIAIVVAIGGASALVSLRNNGSNDPDASVVLAGASVRDVILATGRYDEAEYGGTLTPSQAISVSNNQLKVWGFSGNAGDSVRLQIEIAGDEQADVSIVDVARNARVNLRFQTPASRNGRDVTATLPRSGAYVVLVNGLTRNYSILLEKTP